MFFEAPTVINRPNRPDPRGRGHIELSDDEGRDVAQAEMELCKLAFSILQTHYKGHLWKVHANSRAQLLSIQLAILMDETRHYNIHMNTVRSIPELEKVLIRAGGELLERFDLGRSQIDVDKFLHARSTKRLWNRHEAMPTG